MKKKNRVKDDRDKVDIDRMIYEQYDQCNKMYKLFNGNLKILLIIIRITPVRRSFSFFNAIRILKVIGHYMNRKTQYSTARTAVF